MTVFAVGLLIAQNLKNNYINYLFHGNIAVFIPFSISVLYFLNYFGMSMYYS